MPRPSVSSQILDLQKNADGSFDIYFGPAAPTGKEANWMPIDPVAKFNFFFSSRRRHTRCLSDWSSDVCSSDLKTMEIGRPETDPQIVAQEIAEQLEKRASFRRTMKQAMEKCMDAGAKGIKLQLSGRLGGSEMARCEKSMQGSIPLSTLRAKVEYGFTEASTAQGNIGIKVWVNNGDYLTEEAPDANIGAPARSRRRRGPRRDGGGDQGGQRS